ncbi:MAG: choice-of-anchor J domain-containing protein [Muribaculaceae bacterium]
MKNLLTKLLLSATLILSASSAAVAEEQQCDSLLMYLSDMSAWGENSKQAFYSYPFSGDGSDQRVGDVIGLTGFWGVPEGDLYYLFCGSLNSDGSYSNYYIVTLDCATHELVGKEEAPYTMIANDVAQDPVSGKVYGLFINDARNGYVWGYVDPVTKTRTAISDYTVKYRDDTNTIDQFRSICFSPEGKAFAIAFSGKLYEVDKESGNVTVIGSTGQIFNYVEGATWDKANNRMLTTFSFSQHYLEAVDVTTGKMTQIANLAGTPSILYNPLDYIADKAPARVDDLSLSFCDGSLNGTLRFLAPTTCQDGSQLSGKVNYRIVHKGEVIETGIAQCGEEISINVKSTKSQTVKYSVYTINEAGESLRSVATAFAGVDTPKAPSVTANVDGTTVTLTWNAVCEGINGGYINTADMTYKVVRMPGNKTIAQGLTTTAYTDNSLTAPSEGAIAGYTYKVTATSESISSEPGTSRKIMLGYLTPKWEETFDDSSFLDRFTVIDIAGDGVAWEHNYYNCAAINASLINPKDDWLISPPIYLKKGLSYHLSFGVNAGNQYDEKFEVYMGRDNTAEAMTTKLMGTTKAVYTGKPSTFTSKNVDINVDEDGIYYIGWHATTAAKKGTLYIDNIQILDGVNPNSPNGVSGFSCTPDAQGRLHTVIDFKLPTTTLNGTSITETIGAKIYRDGTLLKEYTNEPAGKSISYTDIVEHSGYYNYSVFAVSNDMVSVESTAKVFVGNSKPLGANKPHPTESTDVAGEVTVNWTPTEKDINGRDMLPESLTYKLIRIYEDGMCDTLATVTGETTYTYTECSSNTPQYFVRYKLFTINAAGMSNFGSMESDWLPVGAPYAAPYKESFKGHMAVGMVSKLLHGSSRDVMWASYSDSETLKSQDNDGRFAAMTGSSYGNSASLTTAKISLAALETPELSFWVYKHIEGDEDQIETLVGRNEEFESIDITTMDQLATGWNKLTLDLSDFAGQTLCLQWIGTIRTTTSVVIDNITLDSKQSGVTETGIDRSEIASIKFYNLSGTEINHPEKGSLVIRKITFADGRVATEKVLF